MVRTCVSELVCSGCFRSCFEIASCGSAPVQTSLLWVKVLSPWFQFNSSWTSFLLFARLETSGGKTASGDSNLYGSWLLSDGDGDLDVTAEESLSRARHWVEFLRRGNRPPSSWVAGGHVQSSFMFAKISLLAHCMAATRHSRRCCALDLFRLWVLKRLSDDGANVSSVMFVLRIGDVVESDWGCSFGDV